MKHKELKEKKAGELTSILSEKMEEVRSLRFDISSKQVKNHRAYRNAKKSIARVLTLLGSGHKSE